MMRILLIDDSEDFRQSISDMLKTLTYESASVESGQDALAYLSNDANWDMILCDINMPNMSGIQLLTYLKKQFPHIPVVMLTSVEDIDVAVQAMRRGAENYILKSKVAESLFDIIEDVIANRSIISQQTGNGVGQTNRNPQPSHNKLIINDMAREVMFARQDPQLTETEFDILLCLYQAKGDVCTYSEITRFIYNTEMTADTARQTLSSHISNLRTKLEKVGCVNCVVTRRSRGYNINPKYL